MILGLQLVSGLVSAAILFLLASGLSLIFGVCRVMNLAHGSFFMLASFAAYQATHLLAANGWGYWVALLVVPLLLAALGALLEILLFRRIYDANPLLQLLPTIGIVFIIGDAVRFNWGLAGKLISPPPSLARPVEILGVYFPLYYGFIVVTGIAVAGAIWLLVNRTGWGLLLRATSRDSQMSAALGVNSAALRTSVFALALWLVGLAGVLYAPIGGANLGSDMDATIDAFAVVVVGGLGSIWGSALAALLIGLIKSFGILVVPRFAMAFVFAFMAIVLILRPQGLFGIRDR